MSMPEGVPGAGSSGCPVGVRVQPGNEELPGALVPSRGGGAWGAWRPDRQARGSGGGAPRVPRGTHPGPAEHTVGLQNAFQVLRSWISAGVTDILSRDWRTGAGRGQYVSVAARPPPAPRCPGLALDPSRPDIHLDIHAKILSKSRL